MSPSSQDVLRADILERISNLKEYTDEKFQTIAAAATAAREIADASAKEAHLLATQVTDTAREAAATAARDTQQAIQAVQLTKEEFLSKEDYKERHHTIEQRINKLYETPWTAYIASVGILLVIIGGIWGLISFRFDSLSERDRELRAQLAEINLELVRRRAEFVDKPQLEETIRRIRMLENAIPEINRDIQRSGERVDRLDTPLAKHVQQLEDRFSANSDRLLSIEIRVNELIKRLDAKK